QNPSSQVTGTVGNATRGGATNCVGATARRHMADEPSGGTVHMTPGAMDAAGNGGALGGGVTEVGRMASPYGSSRRCRASGARSTTGEGGAGVGSTTAGGGATACDGGGVTGTCSGIAGVGLISQSCENAGAAQPSASATTPANQHLFMIAPTLDGSAARPDRQAQPGAAGEWRHAPARKLFEGREPTRSRPLSHSRRPARRIRRPARAAGVCRPRYARSRP